MEEQAPTRNEYVDSMTNREIDEAVEVKGTLADPNTIYTEDQYQTIRDAFTSGKYRTKKEFCEKWGMSYTTLNRILDVTGGLKLANQLAKKNWSDANSNVRKEYRDLPAVKERRKLTNQWRRENKRRMAKGLPPIVHPRKETDRNIRQRYREEQEKKNGQKPE